MFFCRWILFFAKSRKQTREQQPPPPSIGSFNPFLDTECAICFNDFGATIDNCRIMPWKCYHTICYSCYKEYVAKILEKQKHPVKDNVCVMCRFPIQNGEDEIQRYSLYKDGNSSIMLPSEFTDQNKNREDQLQQKLKWLKKKID